jgi:hypothetical protein
MEIVYVVLLSLILCLVCANLIKDQIVDKLNNLNQNKNDDVNVEQSMGDFKKGAEHAWFIMQLSLFKMYFENDILDFESIKETLSKQVEVFTFNPSEFNSWRDKFSEYLDERNKGI